MPELYIDQLRKGTILLDDIPYFWRSKLIDKIEDEKLIGNESNNDILEQIINVLPSSKYSEYDIEEYLSSMNEEKESLDNGKIIGENND